MSPEMEKDVPLESEGEVIYHRFALFGGRTRENWEEMPERHSRRKSRVTRAKETLTISIAPFI